MSERSLRRRHHSSASSSRKSRPPHPSVSPSPRRPTPQPHRHRHENHNVKTLKVMKRCASEPMMMWSGSDGDDQRCISSDGLLSEYDVGSGSLYRPHTCIDVFASSPSLMSSFSPHRTTQGYNKEAKVVVTVTVEGSPGPVKTLVRLGSNVDDTIKVVIDKYNEQGRTPKLDKDAKSSYELHHSYFSLQSLEKSKLIGDVGSRSFYLRKSSSNHSINGISSSSQKELIPARMNSPPPIPPPPFLLPSFIARKISKIVRRTRRLWKVLVCWK